MIIIIYFLPNQGLSKQRKQPKQRKQSKQRKQRKQRSRLQNRAGAGSTRRQPTKPHRWGSASRRAATPRTRLSESKNPAAVRHITDRCQLWNTSQQSTSEKDKCKGRYRELEFSPAVCSWDGHTRTIINTKSICHRTLHLNPDFKKDSHNNGNKKRKGQLIRR